MAPETLIVPLVVPIVALGVGIGTGMLAERRRKQDEQVERRKEHAAALVTNALEAARRETEAAVRAALADGMAQHLGTKNGEIKEDMARIRDDVATTKEYIRNHPILCQEKHLRVDSQINDVRSIAVAADQKAQQALLQGNQ